MSNLENTIKNLIKAKDYLTAKRILAIKKHVELTANLKVNFHKNTKKYLDPAYKVDKRFQSFIQEHRDEGIQAILELSRGKPALAVAHSGPYSVVITNNNRKLYLNRDKVPVLGGKWMDFWEEDHEMTEEEYESLPRSDRAAVEAELQLRKGYPQQQFAEKWVKTYLPSLSGRLWWGTDFSDVEDIADRMTKKVTVMAREYRKIFNKYYPLMFG